MKTLFVLGSVLLLLITTSCEENKECCGFAPVNEKSYIQGFFELDEIYIHIFSGFTLDKINNTITYDIKEPEIYDVTSGMGMDIYIGDGERGKGLITWWDNSNASYYYELVEKIGDISYNKIDGIGIIRTANADTLQFVNITCNKQIDSNHPAGSNLNDIFFIYFQDIYAYVKNGYKPVTGPNYYSVVNESHEYPYTLFGSDLSSVNLLEKPYISNELSLILEAVPEHTDEYAFTVSVTNKQGKTIEKTTDPVRIKGVS